MAATTSSSCPTAGRPGPHRHSGAAGDGGGAHPPDPQGPAHLGRPGRGNRRSRAKCIISAAWPAMAPKRSTPIWPSTRCSTCMPRASSRRRSRPYEVVERYIKSIGKGILKVMSKMGISTYQSYCGAQIFDAVGLSSELIDEYFTGTATMIEGVGLPEVAEKRSSVTGSAFSNDPVLANNRSMSAASTCSACAAKIHAGRPTRWRPAACRARQPARKVPRIRR
jgi:hypothetical protein